MAQAECTSNYGTPVEPDEQRQFAFMVMVSLRSLRFAFGNSIPATNPSLWKKKLRTKDDGSGQWKNSIGLGYSDSLKTRGMIWLPLRLFLWESIPLPTRRFISRHGLLANAIKQSFRSRNVEAAVHKEHLVYAAFKSQLHTNRDESSRVETLQTGAELVIQQLIKDVFKILVSRQFGTQRPLPVHFDRALTPLDTEERDGLRGLTWTMVERVLQRPPNLVYPRDRPLLPGEVVSARNGKAQMGEYRTGL